MYYNNLHEMQINAMYGNEYPIKIFLEVKIMKYLLIYW